MKMINLKQIRGTPDKSKWVLVDISINPDYIIKMEDDKDLIKMSKAGIYYIESVERLGSINLNKEQNQPTVGLIEEQNFTRILQEFQPWLTVLGSQSDIRQAIKKSLNNEEKSSKELILG